MLYIALFFTVWSGVDYFYKNRRVLLESNVRGDYLMKVEIIAVGSELLLGQITNTNATFMSSTPC